MSEEQTPVIPTFHYGPTTKLKSKKDIAIYLIQFFFANPGWTDSYHEADMLSFRLMNAKCGGNPDELSEMIQQGFMLSLSKYFPDDPPMVAVEVGEVLEDGTYDITIAITDQAGVPVIPSGKFRVNKDGSINGSVAE